MPTSQQFQAIDSYDLIAVIPNGTAVSQQIDLAGNSLCGLFIPASFTGTTIKISVATASGGAASIVQKDEVGGGDYTITVATGKYVPITNLAILAGARFITLTSSANEAASRSITLAVRPV